MLRPAVALVTTLISTCALAGWQDEASVFDQGRLAKLEEARAKGLAAAQDGNDIAMIRGVLDAAPEAVSREALVGSWRCRTIKLGGLTPDIVYGWFRCRIADEGGTLRFEKITGTQRLSGTLYLGESGGYVFLGAWSAKGEPVHAYSGNHPSAGADATPDDAIGLLSATAADHVRLELPYPVQESTFDFIELRR